MDLPYFGIDEIENNNIHWIDIINYFINLWNDTYEDDHNDIIRFILNDFR